MDDIKRYSDIIYKIIGAAMNVHRELNWGLLDKKYKMDLVVDDIIIETKSVSHLRPEHRAQLCTTIIINDKLMDN